MVFLAYAAFIIILALPFLIVAMIAGGIFGGGAMAVSGVVNGQPRAIFLGLVLLVTSGIAAATIFYWATTPPPATAATRSPHRVVFETYRAIKARQQAMRWMTDGTFERLAEEQRRAKPQEKPTPPPASS